MRNDLYSFKITQRVCDFCHRLAILSILGEKLDYPENEEEHIALALDTRLADAVNRQDRYTLKLKGDLYFAHIDLSSEVFTLTVTSLSGKVYLNEAYRPEDCYFFDESCVFFIKDSAEFTKHNLKGGRIVGCSIIVPEDRTRYRGTKHILADEELLVSRCRKAFGCEVFAYTDIINAEAKFARSLRTFETPVIALSTRMGKLYAALGCGAPCGHVPHFVPLECKNIEAQGCS